jgi:hypothetical protein
MNKQIEAARLSGIAWADREAEMLRDQGRALPAEWQGMTSDALACLPDDEEDEEAREALAEEVNRAARSRWEDIVTAAAAMNDD